MTISTDLKKGWGKGRTDFTIPSGDRRIHTTDATEMYLSLVADWLHENGFRSNPGAAIAFALEQVARSISEKPDEWDRAKDALRAEEQVGIEERLGEALLAE